MDSKELINGFTGFRDRGKDTKQTVRPYRFASQPQACDIARDVFAQQMNEQSDMQSDQLISRDPAIELSGERLRAIPDTDRRWSWVEVDLEALRHNVRAAKRLLSAGTHLLAVVKADGYGHGAEACAKAALSVGADYLAVATVEEGIKLRQANIAAPLMMLAEPPITSIPLLLGFRILPSIYTTEFAIAYAEMADSLNMKAPYHLAVNTGMNRIGVHYSEVAEFLRQVSFHRALDHVGTFTHFATADSDEPFEFQKQAHRFGDALATMTAAGFDPGIVHAANSPALIRYADVHFNMARLGLAMYGLHPCWDTRALIDLRPVMSVHARITDTRVLPMSEGVSYGLHYRSPGSVIICTIPIGYADGLRRGLSGRTDVLLGGQRCRQVGNICMDQCMFEVDLRTYGRRERLHPQIGDGVLLVGSDGVNSITLDDMADRLGTINYEVATGFALRLPRIYT